MKSFMDASSAHAVHVQNVRLPSFKTRTPRLPRLRSAWSEERLA